MDLTIHLDTTFSLPYHVLKNRTTHIMKSLLQGLITSKTRIRILMRLFLNPSQHAYLRELSGEFNLSPSQIGEELKQLNRAGLLKKTKNGRQINYQANSKHPLFPELHSMVKKTLDMDLILDSIIRRLGNLELAFLVDDYAQGKDTGIIDLLLVGNISKGNLIDLTQKTERYTNRKIRTLVLTNAEYKKMGPALGKRPQLLLWQKGRG